MTRAARALTVLAAVALIAPRADAQDAGRPNPHVSLGGRACEDCHTTADWRAVTFDHGRTGFALAGLHQTAPCTGCHDLRDFRGASRECNTCHADPHRGDAGTTCEQCHTPSGWSLVRAQDAHARTRLPDLGVHASLRCEDCHRRTGVQPFTAAVTPCVSCHQTTYNNTTNPSHATLGFATRCDDCHQLATWSFALFAQHDATFAIYRGSHAGAWRSCASCHPSAGNYHAFTCVTCHTDARTTPEHQGVPGYSWESTACLGCHPGGGSGGDLSFHDAVFPVFSGTHAGQWTACSQCHTDPANRRTVSCLTAGCHVQTDTDRGHLGMAGYAYTTAQCRSCHPDGRAGTFTSHDAIFPVYSGTHLNKWTACADCHTNPQNRSIYSCVNGGCHPSAQTNGNHSGIPGYAYQSAQCLSCHPDGRGGTFAQHDAVFPVYSGPHAGKWTGCEQCHITPGNRPDVSCMTAGCHAPTATNAFHQSMAGYGYTAAQCRTCHPDGRRGRFTAHDPLFPIYSGKHAGRWADCTTCHTDPANRAAFTCMNGACHPAGETNGHHSGIPGYGYTAAQCYSCHSNGIAGNFVQHDAIFAVYTGPHGGTWSQCEQCHITPGVRADVSCLTAGCHPQPAVNVFHLAMSGFGYSTAQCRTCHPDGLRGRYVAHDPLFPIYSGTHTAQWAACTTCHTDPATRTAFTCLGTGCHAQAPTDAAHTGIVGYGYASAQCLTCHPSGTAGTFTQHDVIFPIASGTHAGQWTTCEQCHTTPGDRTAFSCMTSGCHAQPASNAYHQAMAGYNYVATACLTCHPSGTRGRYVAHDPTFPVYSGTHAGQWAQCTQCHTDLASRAVFSCVTSGCHARTTTDFAHRGIPGYGYASTQCLTCHPAGVVGTFTQHDVLFPIWSGSHAGQWASCATCHQVAGDRSVFTCMSSGCHRLTNTNQDHSGVTGYQYIATACYTCHPRGRSN